MTGEPAPGDLRRGQFRVMAVGFGFPVVFGWFGIGLTLHALVDPSLAALPYVIAIPPILLGWLFQYRLWRATRLPDGPERRSMLVRVRRLLALPFLLVALGILSSGAMLAAGPPQPPPHVPLHVLLVVMLVMGVVGACFLPFAARARSYLPAA